MLILVHVAELVCVRVLRELILHGERKHGNKEHRRIQEPNGGPSPIPYGFGGRTGMGMGTIPGEVIVD